MLLLVDVVANVDVDVDVVEQLAAAPEALPGCQDVTTQFPPSATMQFGHALQHCTQATVRSTRRPTCPGHALQR